MKDYADQAKILSRQNIEEKITTKDVVLSTLAILVALAMLYFATHWNPSTL